MKKKQQAIVRIIAIVLVVLLAGGAIVSAVISLASAEEITPERNSLSMEIEYMEDEQALRISQRIVYINNADAYLDRVVFYCVPNMYKRQKALMYETEDIKSVFPEGFLPGGIDIQKITVNGEKADWGYQGTNEIYLRVATDLQPDERCEICFEYYLLLTRNKGFIGADDLGIHLSDFYFIPASYDSRYDEFVLNNPIPFTEYIDTTPMDCTVDVILPREMCLSASGSVVKETEDVDKSVWTIQCDDCRDLLIACGKKYSESTTETDGGTEINCMTRNRALARRIEKYAVEAINACEQWFGDFPHRKMSFIETDYGLQFLNGNACAWIGKKCEEALLRSTVYFCIAQQYFGKTAYPMPVSDVWLSDSICSYLTYLILEKEEGNNAYLQALNQNVVPSLQLTIPGGLTVTSSAALMNSSEYSIIIQNRGAAVFHELRVAMGVETLLSGLKVFYEMGRKSDVLTEMDLVQALDTASGKSWEKYLTELVFNIGDYVNQQIEWLD